MGDASIHARIVNLGFGSRPFAVATVVAVRRPTSAKPGAAGIIHPDGTIEGWVGGSCAQPVVIREALLAMADGQPRLLRISKDGPSTASRHDGVVDVVMSCQSGGTLEIYVEPHLPAPRLWIAGVTPIAQALARLGADAGFHVAVFDPAAEAARFPTANFISRETALDALEPDEAPFVVVASQGQWDEEALLAAFRRDVRYVGLVASPTRAAAVRGFLRDEGVAPERLAALRAPAGIDVGAEGAGEVAISILAELVQVRRGRAPFVAAPGPATLSGSAGAAHLAAVAGPVAGPSGSAGDQARVYTDPVCGMEVDPADARHLAEHEGVVYAFCCLPCRTRFVREPARYLSGSISSAAPAEG